MATQDSSTAPMTDLVKRLDEARKELQTFYVQVRANQLKNVRAIRHKRQEIARLRTSLNQRTG